MSATKPSASGGTVSVRCSLRDPQKAVSATERFSKWKWHVDEVFVKVNGKRHYLWRAVDHEGEVLEASRNEAQKAKLQH